MKNIYIISSLVLFLSSCNSGNVSKDEYTIINQAVSEILKPHGMAFLSQDEMNEIAASNGIDLNRTISEKDGKIIHDAVAERRKFEFAILDTLRQSDIKAYQSILDLDSITPAQENLAQAPLDLNKITFPEHYKKVEKPSGQGEFLGKIILSRAIIDKSGEKAIIHYAKCRDIANKDCTSRFLRFRKMRNEWVTDN